MYEFEVMSGEDRKIADVVIGLNDFKVTHYTDGYDRMFAHPDSEATREDIILFIEDRIIPRNRIGIESILEYMGLEEYDIWEIAKITHGAHRKDNMWLRFKGETITYKDIFIKPKT